MSSFSLSTNAAPAKVNTTAIALPKSEPQIDAVVKKVQSAVVNISTEKGVLSPEGGKNLNNIVQVPV